MDETTEARADRAYLALVRHMEDCPLTRAIWKAVIGRRPMP